MISITDNPISQYYKNEVLPTWNGYTVNHFEAVTPDTLQNYSYLNFAKKRDKIEFTDTEKAVWYSHVELWVKARTTPIIVVEHDIRLEKDIPVEVFESEMCCLAHSGVNKNGSHRKLAGGAYYLTPKVATHMVNHVKNIKRITYNSDAVIHRMCDEFGIWRHDTCYQYQNKEIGVTVEHNH